MTQDDLDTLISKLPHNGQQVNDSLDQMITGLKNKISKPTDMQVKTNLTQLVNTNETTNPNINKVSFPNAKISLPENNTAPMSTTTNTSTPNTTTKTNVTQLVNTQKTQQPQNNKINFPNAHITLPPDEPTYHPILSTIGIAPKTTMPSQISPILKDFPKTETTKATPAISVNHTNIQQASPLLSPTLQNQGLTGNHVVVSIADKKTVVYDKNNNILAEYPAYIGTSKNPTPRGQFKIIENIKPDASEWFYDGHWLGFAEGYNPKEPNGYAGFHGWVYSKDDDEIEKQEKGWKTTTHGCVQLNHKDIAQFANLVGAGDPVTIIDNPLNPPPPKPPLPQGLK